MTTETPGQAQAAMAPVTEPETAAPAPDTIRIITRTMVSLVRTMEAARIEMIQNGPAAAMQWILNGLPDQYDGEYAWDGKESAEAWLDRVEAADRAEAAAVTPTGTEHPGGHSSPPGGETSGSSTGTERK